MDSVQPPASPIGHGSLTGDPEFGSRHRPTDAGQGGYGQKHPEVWNDGHSPTTMYDDYAISDSLFHWQSQSTTSTEASAGRRYIEHRERGSTVLLFVRQEKRRNGLASPYSFLGPADYVSHQGSRPMNIIWKLRHPMSAKFLQKAARLLNE